MDGETVYSGYWVERWKCPNCPAVIAMLSESESPESVVCENCEMEMTSEALSQVSPATEAMIAALKTFRLTAPDC